MRVFNMDVSGTPDKSFELNLVSKTAKKRDIELKS